MNVALDAVDRQPAVLGAGGDHHRPRRDALVVAEVDDVGRARAVETRGALRDHELRAELR
jgi:hypothetical protein